MSAAVDRLEKALAQYRADLLEKAYAKHRTHLLEQIHAANAMLKSINAKLPGIADDLDDIRWRATKLQKLDEVERAADSLRKHSPAYAAERARTTNGLEPR